MVRPSSRSLVTFRREVSLSCTPASVNAASFAADCPISFPSPHAVKIPVSASERAAAAINFFLIDDILLFILNFY